MKLTIKKLEISVYILNYAKPILRQSLVIFSIKENSIGSVASEIFIDTPKKLTALFRRINDIN